MKHIFFFYVSEYTNRPSKVFWTDLCIAESQRHNVRSENSRRANHNETMTTAMRDIQNDFELPMQQQHDSMLSYNTWASITNITDFALGNRIPSTEASCNIKHGQSTRLNWTRSVFATPEMIIIGNKVEHLGYLGCSQPLGQSQLGQKLKSPGMPLDSTETRVERLCDSNPFPIHPLLSICNDCVCWIKSVSWGDDFL